MGDVVPSPSDVLRAQGLRGKTAARPGAKSRHGKPLLAEPAARAKSDRGRNTLYGNFAKLGCELSRAMMQSKATGAPLKC